MIRPLLVMALCCACAWGEAPTTAPTTGRVVDASQVRKWLDNLADASDEVREQARFDLLGLKSAQLPLLVRAARQAAPLAAGQVAALREIVSHVYLSGLAYKPDITGFLGVMLTREDPNEAEPGPIIIESRILGFCSYRMLQDGDIVQEVDGHKLQTRVDLIRAVSERQPGETVRLKVTRQGRAVVVPIVLDARPADAMGFGVAGQIEELKTRRRAEADKYWEETFAPLIAPRAG